MNSKFLILLPPSEGKASGGDGAPLNLDSLSFEALNRTRSRMLKALIQLGQRPRVSKRLLGVKGTALEKAMQSNANVETTPTMPAIERYTGVMYDSIGYGSLDADARRVFDRSTVIMSAVFGMVRPNDLIPDYKLKMSAALLRGKTCAAVWKTPNSQALENLGGGGVIWDLLPLEHSAAWAPSKVSSDARFKFKFLERNANGQLKTVSHLSKALKGALVSHIVGNPTAAASANSALELVENFSHPEGYEFEPEMLSQVDGATEVVFLKR